MNVKRLFIGNVSSETQSNALEAEFTKFGTVKLVEVKSKTNFQNPDSLNYFGFVTLCIDDDHLEKCLNHFKHNQFYGNYLNVSVARESFLDRLKREREENRTKETSKLNDHDYNSSSKKINIEIVNNHLKKKKSVECIEPELSPRHKNREDIEIDLQRDENSFVKKFANKPIREEKFMKHKFANDLKIEKLNVKVPCINPVNDKVKLANEKRLESLNQKQKQYSTKKLIIQKALVSENIKLPNKILFDETDANLENKSSKLFEDDSDDILIDDEFKSKIVFEGSQGEKLLQMQSGFQLDSRFRMNEKFSDDISKQNDTKHESKVTGQIGSTKSGKFNKQMNMIRFDPIKPKSHQLFLETSKCDKNLVTASEEIKTEKNKEVSRDQFYQIQNDFKKSFNQVPESGFSLLSQFNKVDKLEATDFSGQPAEEKILLYRNNYASNNIDLSEDENEVQEKNEKNKTTRNKKDFIESFFMLYSDQRLKDGMDFFKSLEKSNEEESYNEIRNKLRIIINKKISKIKSKKIYGVDKRKPTKNSSRVPISRQ